jgi:NAD(P)-dependent dehydrogenase (short-subunit alcohol dehydrogenase family)
VTAAASESPQPIAVVTGGAGGIGLETVRGLAAAGLRVIAGCRDAKKATAGEGWTLDLARLHSVRAFAARALAELPRLDVLVCNAAVWPGPRRRTADGFELAFGVNHLAHHALCELLRARLVASAPARVVVVSSGLHARGTIRWDDLQLERRYDGAEAYAQSKLANVMFALALARRLEGTGVTVTACHPGVIATGLLRRQPPGRWDRGQRLTPALGARARPLLALAPALAGVTGRYFHVTSERAPSAAALDRAAQDRLWSISEGLVAAPVR